MLGAALDTVNNLPNRLTISRFTMDRISSKIPPAPGVKCLKFRVQKRWDTISK